MTNVTHSRTDWLNAPNLLTIFRIIMTLPFCLCLIRYGLIAVQTMTLLILIALTDFLDGYIARLNHQETRLGKFLDPFADFLLLFCVMLTLSLNQLLPLWLFVLYLLRAVLLSAQLYYYNRQLGNKMAFQSRMLGKICFISIAAYLFMLLLAEEINQQLLVNHVLMSLVSLLMITSWLDYLINYHRQYRALIQVKQ
ncbi:MAG: hypothetical protein CMF46_01660 [Legionellales bacterium]|nr:hypothetical protein [Legionellales bacterium]|tara:strand:+ start:241 stop:828 length:588 start_codon:yes stop_codon:yes gene_type:complete